MSLGFTSPTLDVRLVVEDAEAVDVETVAPLPLYRGEPVALVCPRCLVTWFIIEPFPGLKSIGYNVWFENLDMPISIKSSIPIGCSARGALFMGLHVTEDGVSKWPDYEAPSGRFVSATQLSARCFLATYAPPNEDRCVHMKIFLHGDIDDETGLLVSVERYGIDVVYTMQPPNRGLCDTNYLGVLQGRLLMAAGETVMSVSGDFESCDIEIADINDTYIGRLIRKSGNLVLFTSSGAGYMFTGSMEDLRARIEIGTER